MFYPYSDIGGKTGMRAVPYGIGTAKEIRIGKSAQLLLIVLSIYTRETRFVLSLVILLMLLKTLFYIWYKV